MLVDSPLSFPIIEDYGTPIPPNQEISVNIHNQINVADIGIRSRPLVS